MPIEDTPFDTNDVDPFVKDSSTENDETFERASMSSRRFVDVDTFTANDAVSEESTKNERARTPAEKRKYNTRRAVGGAVILAGATGLISGAINAGEAVTEQLAGPEVSEEMVPVTVGHNDNLWEIAESIPGSDTMDTNDIIALIESDPRNSGIVSQPLHPGEIIYVPASIGDTTEEE